jgi:predicted secreted protein
MTIKGKDVYFYVVGDGGDLMPICCARTASLTTNADIGETSTVGTGKWKTFKGLKVSYTISAGGLISFDMNYSIAKLRERQINFEEINFVFFGTDPTGAMERYSGAFIVTSIGTPTSYNGNWEYSVEGQGTGELTIDTSGETPFSLFSRFGIEDNLGLQDRSIDMQGFAVAVNNSSSFEIQSGVPVGDFQFADWFQANTSFQWTIATFISPGTLLQDGISASLNGSDNFIRIFSADSGSNELKLEPARTALRTNIGGTEEYYIDFPQAVSGYIALSINGNFADAAGNIIIGTAQYADNAAALAAGKPVGYIYRTGDLLKIVH